eukprot:TRINITY_DN5559_c0_g3_i2.p1 TRINITY_DN5559_c0_g3~~TRINITY_DN5559_c0_g3_i2.p1  ORF type:complete len:747 (-),score=108.98 TRINITY_DN5559_c0_g3_i2:92-2332(-)
MRLSQPPLSPAQSAEELPTTVPQPSPAFLPTTQRTAWINTGLPLPLSRYKRSIANIFVGHDSGGLVHSSSMSLSVHGSASNLNGTHPPSPPHSNPNSAHTSSSKLACSPYAVPDPVPDTPKKPLRKLPWEVLHIVFANLQSPRDLCRAGAVCRLWRNVAESDSLWLPLVCNLFRTLKEEPVLNFMEESSRFPKKTKFIYSRVIRTHKELLRGNVVQHDIQGDVLTDVSCLKVFVGVAIIGYHDGTISAWDLSNFHRLYSLDQPLCHSASVIGIAVSTEWIVASGGLDGTVILLNLWSGSVINKLEGPGAAIRVVRIDQDIVACGSDDCCTWIWDLKNGYEPKVLAGHGSSVCFLELLPSYIVSGCTNGIIMIWSRTGEKLSTMLQQGDLLSMSILYPPHFLQPHMIEQMTHDLPMLGQTPCILTVSSFQCCGIWSIPCGRLVKTLNAPLYQSAGMSFELTSCCAPYLLIAAHNIIYCYLIDNDRPYGSLESSGYPFRAISSKRFYRNDVNTCVLVAAVDSIGTIKMWDLELRHCILNIPHRHNWGGLYYPLEDRGLLPLACDFDPTAVLVTGGKFYHKVLVVQSKELEKDKSLTQRYLGETSRPYHDNVYMLRLFSAGLLLAFLILLQSKLDNHKDFSYMILASILWSLCGLLFLDWVLPISNEDIPANLRGFFGFFKRVFRSAKFPEFMHYTGQFIIFPAFLLSKLDEFFPDTVSWSMVFAPMHICMIYAILSFYKRSRLSPESK